MQELIKPDIIKEIKGEHLRLLVLQMSGAITILVNLALSRVLSNVVDLELDEMCTASSKDNFTVIFKRMKTMK